MKLPAVALTACALAAPAALASSLPPCSSTSVTPCSCPNGTAYEQSVTFAVIGAKATDVKALISDYFETAWFGIPLVSTQGPDNDPGVSLRTANLATKVGTYAVTEKLTELQFKPDGSFVQKFELLPSLVPIEYHSGNGSFDGYWVTLQSNSVFEYETAIQWSVYACETGHPQGFAAFHEGGLTNATAILQAQGKILGTNVKPFSIQAF